jgi:hypothetical protein
VIGIQFSVTFDSAAVVGWTPDQRRELLAGLGRVFDALAGLERPDKLTRETCQAERPKAAETSSEGFGAATAPKDGPPASRHRGRPPLTAAMVGTTSVRDTFAVEIRIPLTIANHAGLRGGTRASLVFSADQRLTIERVRQGGVAVVKSVGPTVRMKAGATKLGVTKRHPAEPCACSLDGDHRLVVELPSWWPKAHSHAGRARAAAPEAPPVPAKIEGAPSRKAAIARHPATPAAPVIVLSPQVRSKSNNGRGPQPWTKIPGGELIPENLRESNCNTCSDRPAGVSCDDCNGVFCAACFTSHRLTHTRPGAAAREEVARA